jgi:hypothetical protein
MKKILIFLISVSFITCQKKEVPVELDSEEIPTFTYNAVVYGKVTGCHDLLAIELLDSADIFPYPLDSIINDTPDNIVFAYNLPDSLRVPGLPITIELEAARPTLVYWGPSCWGTPFLYNYVNLLDAAPAPE